MHRKTERPDIGGLEADSPSASFLAGYIPEKEYARQQNTSLRTCQRARQMRRSPPYVRIGKKVYYRIEAVRAWLLENERSADRRPAAPRARRGR